MRAFTCPTCGSLAPFESLVCLHCRTDLAFDWEARELAVLTARCGNRDELACNGQAPDSWCASCLLTRRRSEAIGVRHRLSRAEQAKRRLLFTLLELALPVGSWRDGEGGLGFDLLDSTSAPVTTGHADGIITLDLAEADSVHREQVRVHLDEVYRTVLGHLRHEVGHYYEGVLVQDRARYRALFGDERASYSDALDRHYEQGAPPDWAASYVSAYATMHPFEDFAETFAHYLHLRDTLQTASSWGVSVAGPEAADLAPLASFPVLASDDFRSLVDTWLPLTYALNALNRSMGEDDLYPFVLTPPVLEKLAFVHELVAQASP